MTVGVTSLLTTVQLLLLLAAGTLSHGGSCGKHSSGVEPGLQRGSSITLTVMNTVSNTNPINQTYSAQTAFSGSLLGAMRRLQDTDCSFSFSTTDNIDYGPYLQSVNGVVGKTCDQTYWELLSESADGNITALQLGIGCYLPKHNEHIILRFTKW